MHSLHRIINIPHHRRTFFFFLKILLISIFLIVSLQSLSFFFLDRYKYMEKNDLSPFFFIVLPTITLPFHNDTSRHSIFPSRVLLCNDFPAGKNSLIVRVRLIQNRACIVSTRPKLQSARNTVYFTSHSNKYLKGVILAMSIQVSCIQYDTDRLRNRYLCHAYVMIIMLEKNLQEEGSCAMFLVFKLALDVSR